MTTPVAYGKRKNSPTSRRKIALVKFDLYQTFTVLLRSALPQRVIIGRNPINLQSLPN